MIVVNSVHKYGRCERNCVNAFVVNVGHTKQNKEKKIQLLKTADQGDTNDHMNKNENKETEKLNKKRGNNLDSDLAHSLTC